MWDHLPICCVTPSKLRPNWFENVLFGNYEVSPLKTNTAVSCVLSRPSWLTNKFANSYATRKASRKLERPWMAWPKSFRFHTLETSLNFAFKKALLALKVKVFFYRIKHAPKGLNFCPWRCRFRTSAHGISMAIPRAEVRNSEFQ